MRPVLPAVRYRAHDHQFEHRHVGGQAAGLPRRSRRSPRQPVVEIFAGLPILFVLIILVSIVEPNVIWLLEVLGLFSWTALVGVVRAEFLRMHAIEPWLRVRESDLPARSNGFPKRLPKAPLAHHDRTLPFQSSSRKTHEPSLVSHMPQARGSLGCASQSFG